MEPQLGIIPPPQFAPKSPYFCISFSTLPKPSMPFTPNMCTVLSELCACASHSSGSTLYPHFMTSEKFIHSSEICWGNTCSINYFWISSRNNFPFSLRIPTALCTVLMALVPNSVLQFMYVISSFIQHLISFRIKIMSNFLYIS